MKKYILLVSILTCLASCGKRTEHDASAPLFENTAATAVAQVGPEIITQEQFNQRLAQLEEQDRIFAKTPLGRQLFAQLMAREQLAALDAKDIGLDKSANYQQALAQKRAELQAIYAAYSTDLLSQLWQQTYQDKGTLQVTDAEIEAYYKKYPYEMTIKQIILPDAETADAVWRQLRNAKNKWSELEHRYSVAPAQSIGKEFSFMPGEFIPELEVIAANSPTGSVQGFVKTAQGFHIIMKTGERRLNLQEASPRIRSVLENKKMDDLLDKLQTKYEVIIYEQND